MNSPRPFWINPVNHQPAVTEINDESMLDPIFETTGRNAHVPIGVGSAAPAHVMCKPHVSSGHVRRSTYASLLLASLLLVSSTTVTSF